MEENKNNNIENNKKIGYALSALMFFAPLIKYNLKTDESISQSDKSFVNGFIKLGYLNIILVVLAIISQIIYMNTKNPIYQTIKTWIFIVLVVLLLIGSLLAILKKNINLNDSDGNGDYNKILSFIPLYNIYLWYEKHDFDGENISLKFGIFLRSLFSMSLILFHNKYINIIFLLLIIICAISTVVGINFGNKGKNFVNKIFQKNPEEIRGYIVGTIASFFNKEGLTMNINKQKNYFNFLFKLEDNQIILEYILFGLISISLIVIGIVYGKYQLLLGLVIVIGRYLIMIINRNHIPHIPILKEITNIFFRNKQIKNA